MSHFDSYNATRQVKCIVLLSRACVSTDVCESACGAHVLNGDDLWLDTIVSSQYPSLFNRVICNQAKGRENVVGGCASRKRFFGRVDGGKAKGNEGERAHEDRSSLANIRQSFLAIWCMHWGNYAKLPLKNT